jgi:hypothetical protein
MNDTLYVQSMMDQAIQIYDQTERERGREAIF